VKILHAYKDFNPPIRGGIEGHIAMMCHYQQKWAEVEMLSCSRTFRTRRMDRNGTSVLEVGEWGRFLNAPVAPGYPWHLKRNDADIIVVHMPNPTAELGCLLARPRAPIVVRYHSDVVRQAGAMKLYKPALMHFLSKVAMIIPTSEPYLATSPYLQAFQGKCRVVPLGIIPERFQSPAPEKVAALKNEYGGDFVLFSGMHRYYKGLHVLVQAAAAIRAKVVIAGDGPTRAENMALAEKLGVDIHFPGALSHEDLVAHLHACAVFAFPSVERSEAFGISIMEAHAAGKPVVATQLGTGVEFINQHETTGYNVPPGDPQALAEAVNALLADPEKRDKMGQYARNRIQTDFCAEAVASKEFNLYQEVLGCPNSTT
jgi:rhamnosyl/mannosyltransferase